MHCSAQKIAELNEVLMASSNNNFSRNLFFYWFFKCFKDDLGREIYVIIS